MRSEHSTVGSIGGNTDEMFRVRKKVETKNGFESFLVSLKSQVGDSEGLGGKMESSDKKTILDEIKKGQDWLDANGVTASVEEIEEQREQSVFFLALFELARTFLLTRLFYTGFKQSLALSQPRSTKEVHQRMSHLESAMSCRWIRFNLHCNLQSYLVFDIFSSGPWRVAANLFVPSVRSSVSYIICPICFK